MRRFLCLPFAAEYSNEVRRTATEFWIEAVV